MRRGDRFGRLHKDAALQPHCSRATRRDTAVRVVGEKSDILEQDLLERIRRPGHESDERAVLGGIVSDEPRCPHRGLDRLLSAAGDELQQAVAGAHAGSVFNEGALVDVKCVLEGETQQWPTVGRGFEDQVGEAYVPPVQGQRHVSQAGRLARIGGMQVEIDGLTERRFAQRQPAAAVGARGKLDLEPRAFAAAGGGDQLTVGGNNQTVELRHTGDGYAHRCGSYRAGQIMSGA